jgi:tetratricopeptide (TPR) repeat protein
MSQSDDFSHVESSPYHDFTAAECLAQLEDADTPAAAKPLLWYQHGTQMAVAGDQAAALHSFDRAIADLPDFVAAWLARGQALAKLGQIEAAISNAKTVLQLQPNSCQPEHQAALCHRGEMLLHMQRPQAALRDLDRVLMLDPAAARPWVLKAIALGQMHQLEAGLKCCERAISLQPEDPEIWRIQAGLLRRAGQYDAQAASLEQALQRAPHHAALWAEKAATLRHLRRYDESLRSYDESLHLQPENARWWHRRGLVLRRMGRYEEAIASFDRALAHQPGDEATIKSRLATLLTSGQLFDLLLIHQSARVRHHLWRDLQQVLVHILRRKLPTLVVIGITALVATHSQGIALVTMTAFLILALWSSLIQEVQR